MAKNNEVATCPNCGSEYPERDIENEPVYECTQCGIEGFDCCVAGNNALCEECLDEQNNG